MSRRPRRNHSAAFKAKVAMDALRDGQTIAEVAQRHDVHPNQVTEWRRQLQERAADVFGGAGRGRQGVARQDRATDPGERFFRKRTHQGGIAERKAMIDRSHKLPIKRQAERLSMSRGSVYDQPEPVSEEDLRLMRRIDELQLEHPFAGSRMLRDMLRLEGVAVGRRHVGTLMQRMGLQALYRRPNTSRR